MNESKLTPSIEYTIQSVETSLQEQTKAYFPWTDKKCKDQMQNLLQAIQTSQESLHCKKTYTVLTDRSCQNLFKSKPWFIYVKNLLFQTLRLTSEDFWSKSKDLATQIRGQCLIPFEEILIARLLIIQNSTVSPQNIKIAANNLAEFLKNPDSTILNDDTLDLLSDENIFPKDLDFEKDNDLTEIQLYLKNQNFTALRTFKESHSKYKIFIESCEKLFLNPKEYTINDPSISDNLNTLFQNDPLSLKSFILHSLPTKEGNETLATKLTALICPPPPVSNDPTITSWSSKTPGEQEDVTHYVLLSYLLSGDTDKINTANAHILTLTAKSTPLKTTDLHSFFTSLAYYGEYDDFSTTTYTTILHRCKNTLTTEARDHLLKNVLKWDGGEFSDKTPHLPILPETENHILMINSSRYLKNKWLQDNGNTNRKFDNIRNGLEEKLLDKIHSIKKNGLDEYNSMPYIAYSMTALLNLYEFGSLPVQMAAKEVLDDIADRYAHSSVNLKSFPPFRRQKRKGTISTLDGSYPIKLFYKWLSKDKLLPAWMQSNPPNYESLSLALAPACTSYKLQEKTKALLTNPTSTSFTQISHSSTAIGGSPEIYYKDHTQKKSYLLSAGGAYPTGIYRSLREIMTRPTTLILDDNTLDLKDLFYLGADSAPTNPSEEAYNRNNTGVYHNFACGACHVHTPEGLSHSEKNGKWKLYQAMNGLFIAVYSEANLGIMALFKDKPDLLSIASSNPNPITSFTFPDGHKLTYDTKAPQDQWVMKSEITTNGIEKKFERDFAKWDPCKNIEIS